MQRMQSGSTNKKQKKMNFETIAKVNDVDWNRTGDTLAIGGNQIKLYKFIPTGLYLAAPRILSCSGNQVSRLKFLDQNIFGALTNEYLNIWDIRSQSNFAANSIRTANFLTHKLLTYDWNVEKYQTSILDEKNMITTFDYRKCDNEQQPVSVLNVSSLQMLPKQISWHKSGKVLFCGGSEQQGEKTGKICMISEAMQLIQTFKCHLGPVTQIELSKSGDRLVTVAEDSLVQIHSLPQLICQSVISLSEEIQTLPTCKLSHNDHFLALSHDKIVTIYTITKGNMIFCEQYFQQTSIISWHPLFSILGVCQRSGNVNVIPFRQ